MSYLCRGIGLRIRDVRLVQGVICRTYFRQFSAEQVFYKYERKEGKKYIVVYRISEINFKIFD